MPQTNLKNVAFSGVAVTAAVCGQTHTQTGFKTYGGQKGHNTQTDTWRSVSFCLICKHFIILSSDNAVTTDIMFLK